MSDEDAKSSYFDWKNQRSQVTRVSKRGRKNNYCIHHEHVGISYILCELTPD
jgi:hypothetical protein